MKNNNTKLLLTLLLVAFIVLKLTNYINWSWWWVMSPIWIPASLVLIVYSGLKIWARIYRSMHKEEVKDLERHMEANKNRKSKWERKIEEMQKAKNNG